MAGGPGEQSLKGGKTAEAERDRGRENLIGSSGRVDAEDDDVG